MAALHLRASEWFEAAEDWVPAIEHAFSAGDVATVSRLIQQSWVDLGNHGRHATIQRWLTRMPADHVQRDVRLLLVRAWVAALSGHRDDSLSALAGVERIDPSRWGPLVDGFSSVESSTTLLRAMLPWGDVGQQLAQGRRAVELERPGSKWHAGGCWALAAGHYFRGELAEADAWFDDAFAEAVATGQWIVATSAAAYRSLIAGGYGHRDEQLTFANRARELARDCRLEDVVGEAHTAAGIERADAGDHVAALALLQHGAAVMRAWGQPTELAHALLRLLPTLLRLDRIEEAERTLVELRATIEDCPDPGALGSGLEVVERSWAQRSGAQAGLSDRELEVLSLLGQELSERAIAEELFLSFNTVHTHVRAIYRKLQVGTRREAVDRARALGLIAAESPR